MIILDSTLKSLELKLAGAPATTQPPFVASYVDISQTTFGMTAAAENDGAMNGSTAVTAAAAPSASTTRQLKFLSVFNVDTAAVVLTVQVNNNGTARIVWKATLAIGDTLVYVDGQGFSVFDTNGQVKLGPGVNVGLKNTTNTWDLIQSFTSGIKERGRTALVGEWTTPAFSAGDFTGSGSMTVTVGSGDVSTYEYMMVGKAMTVVFSINGITIGGTPSSAVRFKIPGGFTVAKGTVTMCLFQNGGTYTYGIASVDPGQTVIEIYYGDFGVTNWAASTDATSIRGQITFEVQ